MTDLIPWPPRIPKERQRRVYNPGERAILNPFKAEYRQAGSPQARKQIFVSCIWPAIYLYWHETTGITAEEDLALKAKELAKWIHNTWRPHHTAGRKRSILTIRKTDLVWAKQRDEVIKEIAIILGIPEATTSTEGWFENRTPAIHRILSRMTTEETRQLEEEVKEIQSNGYPEEERRILAEKHCTRRLDDSATAHWLEMGALTISFVAYMTPDGQLGVETHDIAAALANVSQDSFEDLHASTVREIQRLWLEYVRDLTNKKNGITPMVNVPGHEDLSITHNEHGYPLLPAGLEVEKLTKKVGARLLREYLKEHYNLASYRQNSHVPYGDLTKNIRTRRKFVKNKFMPPDFVLKDPHNMSLADLKTFIQFLLDRQSGLALPQVFRFSCFKMARKGGETIKSLYPDEIDSNNPPVFTKGKKSRHGAGAIIENSDSNESQPEHSEEENPIADERRTERGSHQMAPAPAPAYTLMPHMSVGEPTSNPGYNDSTQVQNLTGNSMMYSQEDYSHDWATTRMDIDPVGWAAGIAGDPFDEHTWPVDNPQGHNGPFNMPMFPGVQIPTFNEFGLGNYDYNRQNNMVDYGVDINMPPSDHTTPHYEEYGQSNSGLDADADGNADADAAMSPTRLSHIPRPFLAGSSGIRPANPPYRKKPGRRADDIAREEAEVLGGRVGDKRQRKIRVRQS